MKSPVLCRLSLLPAAAVVILALGLAAPAPAAPQAKPVYAATFLDHVSGKNAFKATDGKRYWTVDAGADSYQHDFYERPTAAEYKVIDGKFATAEYFAYIDIVQARVGFDAQ